jgi:hypothetical protein
METIHKGKERKKERKKEMAGVCALCYHLHLKLVDVSSVEYE